MHHWKRSKLLRTADLLKTTLSSKSNDLADECQLMGCNAISYECYAFCCPRILHRRCNIFHDDSLKLGQWIYEFQKTTVHLLTSSWLQHQNKKMPNGINSVHRNSFHMLCVRILKYTEKRLDGLHSGYRALTRLSTFFRVARHRWP